MGITACHMHLRLHKLITTYSSANSTDAHGFQDIKKVTIQYIIYINS